MKLILQMITLVGLGLMAAAGVTYTQSAYFVSRARLTTGTVVSLFASVDTDTNSTYYCPQISFTTTTGQTVNFGADTCSAPPAYQVGDLVNLYYDPQNPQNARMKSFGAQYLLPLSYLVAGLPLVLLGVFGLLFQRRRERARQDATAPGLA